MRAVLTTAGELAGIAAITVGLAQWLVPVAWVFAGAAVVFVSVWNGREVKS